MLCIPEDKYDLIIYGYGDKFDEKNVTKLRKEGRTEQLTDITQYIPTPHFLKRDMIIDSV